MLSLQRQTASPPAYPPRRRAARAQRAALLVVGAMACAGVCLGATAGAADRAIRRPPAHASWQWQLTGRIDLSVRARVFDVDGFDVTAATVARLHRLHRYVVCYVDVGTWEDWRPDSGRFPQSLLGSSNGWPGERWLDVRRLDVLGPIMRDRIRMCRSKGFDAVEPDNVDGYSNDSGFPLSGADQLTFNRWVAHTAHALHLAVALKNDLEQAGALASSFDFALLEQCVQYQECSAAAPFLRAHKAVFDAEYSVAPSAFCPVARRLGLNAQAKRTGLDSWRAPCR
jgi:hypothetical protein